MLIVVLKHRDKWESSIELHLRQFRNSQKHQNKRKIEIHEVELSRVDRISVIISE